MFRMFFLCVFFLSTPALADAEWQFDTGGRVTGKPVVTASHVYVTGGTHLYALDKEGNEQWRFDAGAPTFSGVTIVGERIYMLADNGLHALDMEGNKIGEYLTEDGAFEVEGTTWGWGEGPKADPWSFYRSAPIHVDGKIIFGTKNGTFAVGEQSGELLWHAETGQSHTIPVHNDGIVVIGSWDNNLYGLNIEDGSIAWTFSSRLPTGKMAGWIGWEGFNLDPVLYEGYVLVGNRGTYFYLIEVKTGEELWSTKHPTSWIGSPAFVAGDEVYYGNSDGLSLEGRKIAGGNQTLLFKNNMPNFAQPQANDSHVYFGSLAGEVFAVDRTSGEGKKLFATSGNLENGPKLIKPEGGYNFLNSVEGADPYEATILDVNAMVKDLGAILSLTLAGDRLYAGSGDGKLYAISVK